MWRNHERSYPSFRSRKIKQTSSFIVSIFLQGKNGLVHQTGNMQGAHEIIGKYFVEAPKQSVEGILNSWCRILASVYYLAGN